MNAFAKEAKKSDWHKHWHKPGRMREIRKNNTVVKLKKQTRGFFSASPSALHPHPSFLKQPREILLLS